MLTKEIETDIFTELLEDPDLKVNIEAATKLGSSGDDRERTVDALRSSLKLGFPQLQIVVMDSLVQLNAKEAVVDVGQCLHYSTDRDVRVKAIETIAELDGDKAVDIFDARLDLERDPDTLDLIIRKLAGFPKKRVVTILLEKAKKSRFQSGHLQKSIEETLNTIGHIAFDEFISALVEPTVEALATRVLVEVGASDPMKTVPALINEFEKEELDVKMVEKMQQIIVEITKANYDDEMIKAIVRTATNNKNNVARQRAIETLDKISETKNGPKLVKYIMWELLKESQKQRRAFL